MFARSSAAVHMWRRNGIWIVLTFISLAASSDHCIAGQKASNNSYDFALIQRSLAPGLSVVSKLAERATTTPASGIASTLVSELEVGTQVVVHQPEGELSKTNKRAFVAMSALSLVGVVYWISKMIEDYVANSAISAPPWYVDSQMLLRISFVMLSTWFGLGLTAFTQVVLFNDPPRHLTIIEAFYLSSQIVTTVGYGDLTPSRPEGQVFVACYILAGVSLVALLLGILLDRAVSTPVADEAPAHLDEGDTETEKQGEESEDAEKCRRAKVDYKVHDPTSSPAFGQCSRSTPFSDASGPSRTLGVGAIGLRPGKGLPKQLPPSLSSLARSVVIFLIATVAGTLFFYFYPGEGKSIWMAFYMSCVTLTTVGFGATHPVTQGGYLFATFWMVIGVSCTANMIGTLGDSLMKQRKMLTGSLMKDELLKTIDADGSGTIDKIEFLTFELVRKGICQAHEIHSVLALFEHLDTDGSGELDVKDLRRFAAEEEV